MKTFKKILDERLWVRVIDDERSEGNSIMVCLEKGWEFIGNPGCGIQGFETVKEVEIGTRFSNVIKSQKTGAN